MGCPNPRASLGTNGGHCNGGPARIGKTEPTLRSAAISRQLSACSQIPFLDMHSRRDTVIGWSLVGDPVRVHRGDRARAARPRLRRRRRGRCDRMGTHRGRGSARPVGGPAPRQRAHPHTAPQWCGWSRHKWGRTGGCVIPCTRRSSSAWRRPPLPGDRWRVSVRGSPPALRWPAIASLVGVLPGVPATETGVTPDRSGAARGRARTTPLTGCISFRQPAAVGGACRIGRSSTNRRGTGPVSRVSSS